ncbi:MAG: O-antigen ligase family protein [Rhodospirillaceae bacterium]|nr:O-antigen ligase family protein [Rhodospirillales bacterium]
MSRFCQHSPAAMLQSPATPLLLGALVAPLLVSLASLGLAPLFAVIVVWALAAGWHSRPWQRMNRPMAACLAFVVAWGALSTFWALDPVQTARTSMVLAGELFGGMILLILARDLPQTDRRPIVLALAAGFSLNVALLLIELMTPGLTPLLHNFNNLPPEVVRESQLNKLSRSFTLTAILCLPVALALWRFNHRIWAVAVTAGVMVVVVIGHSLASKLGLPLAVAVAWAASRRPVATSRVLAVAMVVTIAAAPLVMRLSPSPQMLHDNFHMIPSSSLHRLVIWTFTTGKIYEKPVLGWGLDGSRTIPGADDSAIIIRRDLDNTEILQAHLPLHPHQAALQWWLELGAVGTAAVAAFLALAVLAMGRMAHPAAPLAATAAAFVVALVSYGIWQSWWQGTLWLVAALCAAMFSNARTDAHTNARTND